MSSDTPAILYGSLRIACCWKKKYRKKTSLRRGKEGQSVMEKPE
jgi:hypothetical protein